MHKSLAVTGKAKHSHISSDAMSFLRCPLCKKLSWQHLLLKITPTFLVRVSRDPEILWPPRIVHAWAHAHCTPLSEYPEIPRYSDYPGTVHGWAHAHCIPLSEILWPSWDSTWMGTCTLHASPCQRYSDHPGTVHGWTQAHCTSCQSIPRSQGTLAILGKLRVY